MMPRRSPGQAESSASGASPTSGGASAIDGPPTLRTPRRLSVPAAGLWIACSLVVIGLSADGAWRAVRRHASGPAAPTEAIDVYVTAKEGEWIFSYPDGRSADTELHVPAGQAVRLILTSRDVAHGFCVPALGVEIDALPGRYTTAWFEAGEPGTFAVSAGSTGMRGEVVVLPQTDYAAWLDGRRPPGGPWDIVRLGERVMVEQECARCHTITGEKALGPTFKGLYGSMVKLQRGGDVLADEAYITESMMEPTIKIVDSFLPVMPSYQGKISAGETAAVVEYIKSLRGQATPPNLGKPGGEGR